MSLRTRLARWLLPALPKVIEPPTAYELERMADLVRLAQAEGRPFAPIPVEWIAAVLASHERATHPMVSVTIDAPEPDPAVLKWLAELNRTKPDGSAYFAPPSTRPAHEGGYRVPDGAGAAIFAEERRRLTPPRVDANAEGSLAIMGWTFTASAAWLCGWIAWYMAHGVPEGKPESTMVQLIVGAVASVLGAGACLAWRSGSSRSEPAVSRVCVCGRADDPDCAIRASCARIRDRERRQAETLARHRDEKVGSQARFYGIKPDGTVGPVEAPAKVFGFVDPAEPVECCDPNAPVMSCCVCARPVHTCTHDTHGIEYQGDISKPCPAHPEGDELNDGRWVCSRECFAKATTEPTPIAVWTMNTTVQQTSPFYGFQASASGAVDVADKWHYWTAAPGVKRVPRATDDEDAPTIHSTEHRHDGDRIWCSAYVVEGVLEAEALAAFDAYACKVMNEAGGCWECHSGVTIDRTNGRLSREWKRIEDVASAPAYKVGDRVRLSLCEGGIDAKDEMATVVEVVTAPDFYRVRLDQGERRGYLVYCYARHLEREDVASAEPRVGDRVRRFWKGDRTGSFNDGTVIRCDHESVDVQWDQLPLGIPNFCERGHSPSSLDVLSRGTPPDYHV